MAEGGDGVRFSSLGWWDVRQNKHRNKAWTVYTFLVTMLLCTLCIYDTGLRKRVRDSTLDVVPRACIYLIAVAVFFHTSLASPGIVHPPDASSKKQQKSTLSDLDPELSSAGTSRESSVSSFLASAPPKALGRVSFPPPNADIDDIQDLAEASGSVPGNRATPAPCQGRCQSSATAFMSQSPTATEAAGASSSALSSHSSASPCSFAVLAGCVPPRRFCRVCLIDQPMRTKHCLDCRRCVRKFDHHCPFIGQCVGERNHRWFLLFLVVHLVVAVEVSHSLLIAWPTHPSFLSGGWWFQHTLLVISIGIACMGTAGLLLLCVTHAYMACSGATTWETFSRRRISYLRHLRDSINPFDEGLLTNLRHFFFPPPKHNPAAWEHVYARRMRGLEPVDQDSAVV